MRPCWLAIVALLGGAGACSTQEILLETNTRVSVIVLEPATEELVARFNRDRAMARPADAKRLSILYPNDQTVVPRAVPPPSVHWKAEKMLDRYELELESPHHRVRIYGAETSVQVPEEVYTRLLGSDAETRITIRLRAVGGPEKEMPQLAEPIALTVVEDALSGELYFWSTETQGIMRARLSAPSATKFFPEPDTDDSPTCVGCHTLSRDGSKLAVAYDGELLRGLSMPARTRLYPEAADATGPAFGWGTFDPSATRLLYANEGRLVLLDADTGAPLSEVMLPPETFVTHPDWSPDGRHVAVTLLLDKHDKNAEVEHASIARIPVMDDGSFGPPEVLVESAEPRDTLCFPSYSPDGAFIAYTRVKGKSKDERKSDLWLVPADGGEPRELVRLNRRQGALDDGKDFGNRMPTWAPGDGPDRYWLTFSSSRPLGTQKLDDKRDQLWLAAIEPNGDEDDPSRPAVWLPFQRLDDSNHRAFWSPAGATACLPDLELCDERDNDCDDRVDEDCCAPEAEVCGDRIDNDCDGDRDEGCACALSDICGSGEDEDCDLRLDEECVL